MDERHEPIIPAAPGEVERTAIPGRRGKAAKAAPVKDFARRLLDWQKVHGRHDLPWQRTGDPYHVWLSEIMLQQTRVDTVIPYFERFVARLPSVSELAAADEDAVLALWSGLGYYARARNLHRAARMIMRDHGGELPRSAAELASLPGIGRSTAAAIAALAFGERAAILDGNVRRMLSRLFAIDGEPGKAATEQQLWSLAEALLPAKETGRYVQAQMDFGATLCTRHRPACERCPFAIDCLARLQQRTLELPVARRRQQPAIREARVAVIRHHEAILLERRPGAGIWGGLLSLPEIPPRSAPVAWAKARLGLDCRSGGALAVLRHPFTHFTLELQPVLLEVIDNDARLAAEHSQWHWLAIDAIDGAALPAAIRRILAALP